MHVEMQNREISIGVITFFFKFHCLDVCKLLSIKDLKFFICSTRFRDRWLFNIVIDRKQTRTWNIGISVRRDDTKENSKLQSRIHLKHRLYHNPQIPNL